MRALFKCIVGILIPLMACSENETEQSTLPTSIKTDALATYQVAANSNVANPITFTVKEMLDVQVKSDQPWCKTNIEVKEAKKEVVVTLVVDNNPDKASRIAKVTVSSPQTKDKVVITVEQLISSLKMEGFGKEDIAPAGDTRTIQISADQAWTLTSSGNWVTFDTPSGTSTASKLIPVKMTITPNTTGIIRSTIIKLSDASGGELTHEILQFEPEITEVRVGDPGVQFDQARMDPKYPQMGWWITAGRNGGIPFLQEQLNNVTKTFDTTTPMSEISKYFLDNKANSPIVLLKNGTYTLDEANELRIYPHSTLIGESRDGVIIKVSGTANNAISFYNADYAGVRNLTLKGSWTDREPDPINWDETLPGKGTHKMINLDCAENCFVDNVKIVNSASNPIWISRASVNGKTKGGYNTIRDADLDGAYCKSGGAQGYFMINGDYNLITGCRVTHLRHISIQDRGSKRNVFYKNNVRQEFSFHVSDGGDNLIEHNQITVPLPLKSYNAIMGPWSNEHNVGGLNFIYRNRCLEENRQNNRPWSDDELYLGPYERSVGDNNPTRYTNFRVSAEHPKPIGRTLYPIILKK